VADESLVKLATSLAIVAVAMMLAAWRLARGTGVRAGAPVVASDVGIEAAATLEDDTLGLRGRPDYLVRERGRGRIYPVEVKPTRDARVLYESDALQLATYMVLTEARYGSAFAGYGVVRYRSAEFRVDLTAELRRRCLAARDGVRSARRAASVHRSHAIAARCAACAVRPVCGEALVGGSV